MAAGAGPRCGSKSTALLLRAAGDENVPPAAGQSHTHSEKVPGQLWSVPLAPLAPLALPQGEFVRAGGAADVSLGLGALVEHSLGAPTAGVATPRRRPAAESPTLAGRVAELSGHVGELKASLAERREGHKALLRALEPIQAQANLRLRAAGTELQAAGHGHGAASHGQEAEEQSGWSRPRNSATGEEEGASRRAAPLAEELRLAVREAMREEAAQLRGAVASNARGVDDADAADENQVAVMQRRCDQAAHRADSAEAHLQAQRAELAATRRDAARAAEVAAAMRELMCRQVDEAAALHQAHAAASARRRDGLQATLATSTSRAQELERALARTRRPPLTEVAVGKVLQPAAEEEPVESPTARAG